MSRESAKRTNRNGIYFADKDTIWSVGIYIRLSVSDGSDISLSVKNQKAIINRFMEREFEGRYEIYRTYTDDGISGTTDDIRISFKEMIHDIKAGRINCVVSKTLSRIFRNYSDQGYFLEEFFPEMGIRFITVESPRIDTYTDPGILHGYELPLNGIVNDRYAEATSAAVRQTFKNMRCEGKFQGGFPPYGYMRDPEDRHSFVVDNDAADIVRQIFYWYVCRHLSIEAIKNRLNSMKIPNPSGYKKEKGLKYANPAVKSEESFAWTSRTVRMILTNRTYLGEMVQGRSKVISYKVHRQIRVPKEKWDIVENRHEPVIETEIFQKAQELLELNGNVRTCGGEISLLSGFIYCADCGRKMHKRKSGKREYYACSTYYKRNKNGCTPHFIKKEIIEAAVLKAVSEQIRRADIDNVIEEVRRSGNEKESSFAVMLLKNNETELARLNKQMENLYFDYNKRLITEDEYIKYRETFDQKKAALEEAKLMLKKEECLENYSENAAEQFDELRRYGNIKKLDRRLLEELVDRIYIDEEKNITIMFRFRQGTFKKKR